MHMKKIRKKKIQNENFEKKISKTFQQFHRASSKLCPLLGSLNNLKIFIYFIGKRTACCLF